MKLKKKFTSLTLITTAMCTVGMIAASQVHEPSSLNSKQEEAQRNKHEQERKQASSSMVPMILAIETQRTNHFIRGYNDGIKDSKRISFAPTSDLVALITYTSGECITAIERCLKPFDYYNREKTRILSINQIAYWALFTLSELDCNPEKTVDELKKTLRACIDTIEKSALLPLGEDEEDVYKHCLNALVATKNEFQQSFSYDIWLEAFARYFLDQHDYDILCDAKFFIEQQNQTYSLAQWLIKFIQLPEETKQKLSEADREATKKRDEQTRREEKGSFNMFEEEENPFTTPDSTPIPQQGARDFLTDLNMNLHSSPIDVPLVEGQGALQAEPKNNESSLSQALHDIQQHHPRRRETMLTRIKDFFRTHPLARYGAYALVGAATIYGSFRLYKHVNMRKLPRYVGI